MMSKGKPGKQEFLMSEIMEKNFTVTAPARLELSNIRGSVEIHPGEEGIIRNQITKDANSGDAARSLFNPPEPAFTNLAIQAGETPLKDILVENLLGLGQGNTFSGAFSNPLELAFKIENGEITGRVEDLSIAGNVYDLLKEVAAVSRESQWVSNTIQAPYILIPEMNVAGKSQ